MIRKVDKCMKCNNVCKLETETNAKLTICPKYLSKRSLEVKKKKDRVNIPFDNYNRL